MMMNEQLRLATDLLNIGVMIVDVDLKVFGWNSWLEINTSISKDDIVSKQLTDFFEVEAETIKRKIKTTLTINGNTYYKPINKSYFLPIPIKRFFDSEIEFMYQNVTISPFDLENSLVLISIYDYTENYVYQKRLQKEYENIKSLNSELSQDKEIIDKNLIFLKTDIAGKIVEASTALTKYYGYTKEFLTGKNPKIFRHKDMPEVIFKDLWNAVLSKNIWKGEIKNRKKDGTEAWVDSTVSPFLDKDGKIIYFTAIYHDISDKKRIEELSKIDPLTKVYNRAFFDKVYQNQFLNHRKEKELSFLILDIDYFKRVNDTFGHKAGDVILFEFANIISSSIRNSDLAFRIGGEEFVILLFDTNKEGAIKTAEKIKQTIHDTTFSYTNSLTCSIGVATKKSNDTSESLYVRADSRLYKAKEEGRDKVVSD